MKRSKTDKGHDYEPYKEASLPRQIGIAVGYTIGVASVGFLLWLIIETLLVQL